MKEQLKELISHFSKMLMDTEAIVSDLPDSEKESYDKAINVLQHVINELKRIYTSDNLKSQNIYLLRQMWSLEWKKAKTVGDYRELLHKADLWIVEHNVTYKDNTTSSIYSADEKTIAQKYPL